eukprot:scaffold609_cov170-Amphora_coffeaeformis.AAC.18
MASTKSLMLLRRSLVASRGFHSTALQKGGMPPPRAPFARSPPRAAPMTENSDALWDDGVAPELALDFDAPHISSREGLYSWLAALSGFGILYQCIKLWTNGAVDDNPALHHATDIVDKDYADHSKWEK